MRIKLFEEYSNIGIWRVFAGLGGGFGGANYIKTFTGTKEDAEREAYHAAIQEYESYEGLHGLRTIDEIMEEDGIEDYNTAQQVYNDEMESWLEYYVEPVEKLKYYVQKGDGYDELKKIKNQILESIKPAMEDVWEILSDSLASLEDDWGKFDTKYDSEKEVVDIGMLDLNVDIGKESYYTIAHETDKFYNRGNTILIRDREKKKEYRKTKSYDSRLSMYGSDFDQDFYDYYKKMNGKVNPFYSIQVRFESEYVDNNTNKMNKMIEDLIKSLNTAMRRLNAKIVGIKYFVGKHFVDSDNLEKKWWVSVNSLSEVKYPNIEISFKV